MAVPADAPTSKRQAPAPGAYEVHIGGDAKRPLKTREGAAQVQNVTPNAERLPRTRTAYRRLSDCPQPAVLSEQAGSCSQTWIVTPRGWSGVRVWTRALVIRCERNGQVGLEGELEGMGGCGARSTPVHHAGAGFARCGGDVTSPTTGGPIRLRIGPDGVSGVEPASAVVSILLPDGPFDDDVRQSFCHLVHFFGSPAAADAWTAQHPGTFWLPVADARGRASAGGPGPRRGQRRLTATRAERRLAAMPGRG
jgi:hypothetical protein